MAQSEQLVIVAGADALAGFERQRAQTRLRAAGIDAGLQDARSVYIALFSATPSPAQRRILRELLQAHATAPPGPYVAPRHGTISPWSSRATDVARSCGLDTLVRLERAVAYRFEELAGAQAQRAAMVLHDPLTESVLDGPARLTQLFRQSAPRPLRRVPLAAEGVAALLHANADWGLALANTEIDYLAAAYEQLGRDPTDTELMMFGQINSEHCRHKIFNAAFTVDGEHRDKSLFDMIRASHRAAPEGVLSAYRDNAAVAQGPQATRLLVDADRRYRARAEPVHLLMKVETHNHPSAIAPFAGAATGTGGEIRDEAATGRGGRSKAGLCGLSVSDLCLPDDPQPWEDAGAGHPPHMASALDIVLAGAAGAAHYGNAFGRPTLAGYLRSFQHQSAAHGLRGYHKPILIAGGMGNIRDEHVAKRAVDVDARLIVLGGAAMLIGLGGGAASSMASSGAAAEPDFASVQRADPELQRRCQEVIDACTARGADNPILSIHDVGAGGLSNALPELIEADDRGGRFRLRDIDSADAALSPMEIWCNEAQERYVLAVADDDLATFERLCTREQCPYAVVGEAVAEPRLTVTDAHAEDDAALAVDMPMEVLFGRAPQLQREAVTQAWPGDGWDHHAVDVADAVARVLRIPAVGSKAFLITAADRSVGAMTVREPMVGPWQTPVADVAVTATGFDTVTGEAMTMGERTPLALLDAPASGRMAVAEAVTNIAAARIARLQDVRLSANWMAASGDAGEDAALYATVQAVGEQLCAELGLAIPVGKDSLSMHTEWRTRGEEQQMRAPLSLIVSAFAPVVDAPATLTPCPVPPAEQATRLLLIDLGGGRNRLGGSALAQAHAALGDAPPDLDDAQLLARFFDAVQRLSAAGRLLAYHDRSDGGLLACLAEMAFAGHVGMQITLDALGDDAVAALFAEELGAVVQVDAGAAGAIVAELGAAGLAAHDIGTVTAAQDFVVHHNGQPLYVSDRVAMQRIWARTSYRLQALRDEPDCARQEYDRLLDADDPGLPAQVSFDMQADVAAPQIHTRRPAVAVVRAPGSNGHDEMAWAFIAAGFEAVDVHMSELHAGQVDLATFAGLAVGSGCTYGDVPSAGHGWAQTILQHPRVRDQFAAFFAREDTFTLGAGNGGQMLAALRDIVPGSAHWPAFAANASGRFEGRTVAVEIPASHAVLLDGMAGSRLPVVIGHGQGRAVFAQERDRQQLAQAGGVALRYIDNHGSATQAYPANPDGSADGINAVCSTDGRVLIAMSHPERVIRSAMLSWHPRDWGDASPWARVFANARRFVG